MRTRHLIRHLLLPPLALLPPEVLHAAGQAAPQPLDIHRSGAELGVILVSLGIFWIVALGTALTLRLRAGEADRIFRLEKGLPPPGCERDS